MKTRGRRWRGRVSKNDLTVGLQVARVVGEECGKLFQLQKQSPETLWSVPENFQLSLEDVSGEVRRLVVTRTVSNVYPADCGQWSLPETICGEPRLGVEETETVHGGELSLSDSKTNIEPSSFYRTCWRTC